jgi:branched-chain amino acid transport system permease protein
MLVNGVLLGGLYCLLGIGMTLIFGVMRIINACHGDLLMVAMYLAFFLFTAIKLDPFVAIFVAMPVLFVLGCAIYSGLTDDGGRIRENSLVLTWGVALVLANLFSRRLQRWPPQHRHQLPTTSTWLESRSASLLLSFGVDVLLSVALYLLLLRSNLGRAIRAIAQNKTAAQLMGINVERVQMISYGIGAALAGAAGAAFSSVFYTFPAIGGLFTVKSFEVIVLGGLGNVVGRSSPASIGGRGVAGRDLYLDGTERCGRVSDLHARAPISSARRAFRPQPGLGCLRRRSPWSSRASKPR